MRSRPPLTRFAAGLLACVALACGGSGSSGGGGGGIDGPGVMWPDRGGGSSSTLPPTVVTGRVVFRSATGEACCVAVDPTLLTPPTGPALLVLDDLPIGPATVTIAGFSTDFAPAVPGITLTCRTVSPIGVAPCDATRNASPAFESAPLAVNILAGVQINLGEIDVQALPFVLDDFLPAQQSAVEPPVQFDFTIADAVTGVAADSVALDVTVMVPDEERPSVFRSLTKRIPLTLAPCADGSAEPCSPDGDLELDGFHAAGVAERLPEGPAEVRITGRNLADPARAVDFRYVFDVLPEPTETPAAPAAEAGSEEEAAMAGTRQANAPAAGDASATGTGTTDDATATNDAAGQARGGARIVPTPTPTATPLP